mgnify:FL=1
MDTVANHFDFSRLTDFQLIFGSMKDAYADPGYTQYIYNVGIIGLIITLFFYIQILIRCIANKIYNHSLMVKHLAEILIFLSVYY